MTNKVHVKKNDQVVVISGQADGDKAIKGKQGKILNVNPKANTVVVEGVAYVTKHQKPRRQGQQGGIVKAEAAMYASKVMPICGKCKKPTRVRHKVSKDGSKARVCKHCGAEL